MLLVTTIQWLCVVHLPVTVRKDKTSWNKERSSLRAASANMTEKRKRLEATNSQLIGERDELLKRLCGERNTTLLTFTSAIIFVHC